MKPNELMVGDWVHCAKLDYAPENYVANMQINQLYVADLDTYSFKELKYDEIEPVPLTGEILKRNGFRNNKLSHDEGDWYYNVNLEEVKGGLWINVVSSRNVLHGRKEFCGLINYVHELQHAMKLCGIEKDIEL